MSRDIFRNTRSPRGMLQSCEGPMKDILLILGVTEAQHILTKDSDECRRKLARMCIAALKIELDEGGAGGGSPEQTEILKGGKMAPSALSIEPSAGSPELDRAASALSRSMGDKDARYA